MKVKVLKSFDNHKVGQVIDLPDNVADFMLRIKAML
jgi:hypothetical protein